MKHSSARRDEHNEGEDIVTTLPNALLTQILSYLPQADVKQTRFLSNGWKDIWAFLPNLRLVMPYYMSSENAKKFHDFVDRTLALRNGTPIDRFYLYCSKPLDYDRAYEWLCTVVKCKVQKIELRFPTDNFRVKFCWNLFRTCDTLVELTLSGEFVLDVPKAESLFPCLKKINLLSVIYSSDESLTNLITGCPVLEELFVEKHMISCSDNLGMFKVSSHSLKTLRTSFKWTHHLDCKVVIDAPNLEYMHIVNEISSNYTFMKPLPRLVEAYMETLSDINIKILLSSLSSAKILTIPGSTLQALGSGYDVYVPVFPNLVKLVIGVDPYLGWFLLPTFFESMPNLEHITFSDGLMPNSFWVHLGSYLHWDSPMEVPHCLQFTLKEIIIDNKEAITYAEFPLICYLVKHSYHLETLCINAHNIDHETREELLKFRRGSPLCRIKLI